MGFFSNILKLVFIGIAIAIVICFIIVLSIPWYSMTIVYQAAAPDAGTQCTTSGDFYWFSTKFSCTPAGVPCVSRGCSQGEIFPGVRTDFWCQSYGCSNQSAVYICCFVATLFGFLCMLAATIIYALPMMKSKLSAYVLGYVAFAWMLVALLITFALVPASQADSKNNSITCSGGPCASWAGSKVWQSGTGPQNESWGPAGGWIFGIIVAAAALVWSIVACCCCSSVTDETDKDEKA